MLRHLLLLLGLLPGLALAQPITIGGKPATFGSAVATWVPSTAGAPANLQVILQGQNEPTATQNTSCQVANKGGSTQFLPNENMLGWQHVTGASSYGIYRAVNGGSYPSLGSPTYTVTESVATTNYTTYTGLGFTTTPAYGNYIGIGTANAASGVDRAYNDTSATAIVGNSGFSGAPFYATSATLNGTTTLSVTAVTGGVAAFSITTGGGSGGSGYVPGTYTADVPTSSNGLHFTGGTCTSVPKATVVVNGSGVVSSVTFNYSPGNGCTVGDVLTTSNTSLGGTGSGLALVVTANIVVGQGVGDVAGRIPLGTTITSGTGGAGTYTMSQAATGSASGVVVGSVISGNQVYTYKVTATVGGVESALSTAAYLPFITNGGLVLANGTFDSCLGTFQSVGQTSPLGYTQAVGIFMGTQTSGGCSGGHPAYLNSFSGHSSANFNLNTGGYNYLNIAFNPNISGLSAPNGAAEICGDVDLQSLNGTQMSSYGPSSWPTANTWYQYKVPLSAIYTAADSGVLQNAMYKITWGISNSSPPNNTIVYVEYWFTVN